MLQITVQRSSANKVVYRLAGEITADQVPRLEALVDAATASGHELALDVSGVWRVDRPTAGLVARLCSSPALGVRLEGADQGLLAWLRNVVSGDAEGSSLEGTEGTPGPVARSGESPGFGVVRAVTDEPQVALSPRSKPWHTP